MTVDDLPASLQRRIERVTAKRFQKSRAAFKLERASVVAELRSRGLMDIEIAETLGFTKQYMEKAFPKGQP